MPADRVVKYNGQDVELRFEYYAPGKPPFIFITFEKGGTKEDVIELLKRETDYMNPAQWPIINQIGERKWRAWPFPSD